MPILKRATALRAGCLLFVLPRVAAATPRATRRRRHRPPRPRKPASSPRGIASADSSRSGTSFRFVLSVTFERRELPGREPELHRWLGLRRHRARPPPGQEEVPGRAGRDESCVCTTSSPTGDDQFRALTRSIAAASKWSGHATRKLAVRVRPCEGRRTGLHARIPVLTSCYAAGWSSQVARRAHNPEVVGSNPTPATPRSPC